MTEQTVSSHPTRLLHRRQVRIALFFMGDTLCVVAAALGAFLLAESHPLVDQWAAVAWVVGLALVARLPMFYFSGLPHMSWRLIGARDLLIVGRAVTLGSLAFAVLLSVAATKVDMPAVPTLLTVDFLVSMFLVGGFHMSRRAFAEVSSNGHRTGRHVLIIGAGMAGELVARAMLNDQLANFCPVGFIDDDPAKLGTVVHGIKVLGTRKDMAYICREKKVEEVLIAIPSAEGNVVREILNLARQTGVTHIRTVPSLAQLFSREKSILQLQDLEPEDLLRRKRVTIDCTEIEEQIKDRVVMVTGAGGSIGSELCRQLAEFSPGQLLLVERDETALFEIARQLGETDGKLPVRPLLGDICDRARMEHIYDQYRPDIVFHAAAYKHVPMMEEHPCDAVRNNVIGTRVVAELAIKYGVRRFTLISTDKAVSPSSVMGATKRLAEMTLLHLNRLSKTRLMAVRFGNVLGSRGSIIPIFKEQIKRGGPITVTHPDMRRYFMTTSEAVLLVLQATAIGHGGEVFVLDMGEPVRILDLARDMVHMVGMEPDVDIPIVFIGMRPGEKLFEDILTAEEGTEATRRDKIHVARMTSGLLGPDALLQELEKLDELARNGDREALIAALRRVVPNYTPAASTGTTYGKN